MRKIGLFIVSVFMMMMAAVPAMALSVLEIDTTTAWQYSTVNRVTGIDSVTRFSVADFATANLNNYDVLVVSETFTNSSVTTTAQGTLDALYNRSADIAAWLQAGHGIVALSEPTGTNPYAWLPFGITLGLTGTGMGNNAVSIVDSTHEVMSGLTDATLSNWGTSAHNWFFSNTGSLDVLANDGSGHAVTLAGQYGAGRVVLSTQDADFHDYYNRQAGQLIFMQNAIDWVSDTSAVPEPATMILLGLGLIGLAGAKRKL